MLKKRNYPLKMFTLLPAGSEEIPIEVSAVLEITLPYDYKERLDVEDALWWFAWWECVGDECIVATLRRNLSFEEFTSDWVTFMAIMAMNPVLEDFNLGSSDEEAEYMLLVKENDDEDNGEKTAYIVSTSSFYNFLNALSHSLRQKRREK
ncbi:MAG: hypothetical protein QIT33_gp32 [Methanophagales virus PBV300]|uniref:Uncharacterized protein n=1 Tax=Methanophagales virus PBV300 TaxID=2987731 RepID=A0ABY6GMD6_9VIRU|nr:MAG: hypothetical protein QIT33_gp32 [Methanophagales virus PBV300]UYL64994.1 MAG: hypothetical protein JBCDKDKM_00032 [Methanophagales virus PBV300]